MFTAQDVKNLREKTGAGMLDCKKALDETKGNIEEAINWLREKGISKALKKAERIAAEGLSEAVSNDTNAVIIEVNCETDFVARTADFKEFAHQVAMQIAAMNPVYTSEADIPEEEKSRVKAEAEERVAKENKPAEIAAKIVDGQVSKYFSEKVLLEQKYIMDDSKTIDQFLKEAIAKLGENIVIRRFSRIELGVSE
jgi:elongation factor Ts